MQTNHEIRVLVYKDEALWIAQCLEYDIGVQAKDFDSVHDLFERAMAAEYTESMKLHGKAFAGIEQAPQHFFDKWNQIQVKLEQHIAVDGAQLNAGLKIAA